MNITLPATDLQLSLALFDAAQASARAFVASDGAASATSAFGPRVSRTAVAAAVDGFERDGWPTLRLVDAGELHGARAAYDASSHAIYLSREFVLASAEAPAAIVDVLVEEIGHAIDAQVSSLDSAGDEGAIFAALASGRVLGTAELDALRVENDHGTATIDGKAVAVEFAAPIVGTVTLDGSLADWTAADQIDRTLSMSGYDIYAKVTGNAYVFAIKAPVAIGADTTTWLNTDQNASTGYQIWDFAGGTEYNINFDATGTPRLYTGDSGQTLVSGATVSFGYSADRTVVEFAVATGAIGSPTAINTLWDINDNAYLPTDYSLTQYSVSGVPAPVRTDFTKKIGIVYSETSAAEFYDPTAYSQLFMAAQNQAAMAGVRYDVLTEADLTNLSKLINYDALLFPAFANVKASEYAAIEKTLTTAATQYRVGLIASGDFMTNDQTGAALPGDPYSRMKTLLEVESIDGGYPANVTVRAGDISHPMMQDYAAQELIRSYTGAGWRAYAPVDSGGTSVLATQTIGTQTFDAVIATTSGTGGRNVHFSSDQVMGDNNLLWQAIDYVVNGSGVTAGVQLSRNASIVASRNDMDQAMVMSDVSPSSGPGIYDKLVPILQQWKTQYNFVGSYYIDIGNEPPTFQTNWAKSGQYYKQMLAMGNELGSHSTTHPHDTNALTTAEIQTEFQGSRQIIEQQMSQILGRAFTVDGAALPGAPESLSTALKILPYYDYISGGFSGATAGYPGAIGYLNPAMAAQDKVYIAPNVEFDYTLIEWKGMTPAQAQVEWAREVAALTAHADVPVIVWPWHDYGGAAWGYGSSTSLYTTAMFTDFISKAYTAGAEFVTLADLADRVSAFGDTSIRTSISGNTVTATVTSTDAGRFALDLDNLGAQTIASVTGWYAYDTDSVFLPRNGGTYTIQLGASPTDVTHITALPMRADLISLSGNGTNLSFSVFGEGKVTIDLVNPSGKQLAVTGATISSLVGDKLTLDLGAIGQHDVSVTLSASANRAPTITSNGGGATATIAVAENTTAVTTVTATDPDAGQALSYSIVGGADSALFSINAAGALRFAAARNYETPADSDRNNSYVVQVRVADNGSASLSDTQTITVNVGDVNDNAPVITTAASFSIAENTTVVGPLASTDADSVGTKPAVFSISGGADAARFSISSGNLVFVSAPNFESPTDADRNNSYVVQVSAADGAFTTNKVITVNVTDVAETGANRAPTITSNGGGATATVAVAENAVAVTTITAGDPDAGQTLSYAIVGGADQAFFSISAAGALGFAAPRNFEAPADADRNNTYVVQVRVADNGSPSLSDTQTITVNVADLNDNAPLITTAATFSLAENTTAVGALTSTDADTVGTRPAVFSISGGADAPRFAISNGNLVFASPPNYESPNDADRNNSYIVQVSASDGTNVTNKIITVNVTDVAEGATNRAPVITSNGGGASAAVSLAENSAAVTTVVSTDADTGQTRSYFVSGGADAAKFGINATTGVLSFTTAPDFELPTDSGANNVYDVIVGVRDSGGLTDTQALAVTVTNLNGVYLNGDENGNVLTGTNENDTLSGNGGNDTLIGLAGNDVLYGGAGSNVFDGGAGADHLQGGSSNDIFIWDPADSYIAGGGGMDTLRISGSGVTLDVAEAISRNGIDGMNIIDLTGSGNNTAVVTATDVFTMTWDNYLRVEGNAGDRVTVLDAAEWTADAAQTIGAQSYNVWNQWGAQLLIDTDVTTNLV